LKYYLDEEHLRLAIQRGTSISLKSFKENLMFKGAIFRIEDVVVSVAEEEHGKAIKFAVVHFF